MSGREPRRGAAADEPEGVPAEQREALGATPEADAPEVLLARMRLQAAGRGDTRRSAAEAERARSAAAARKAARAAGSKGQPSSPDGRDPVGLERLIGSLIRSRGWSEPVAVGSVLARWDEIVGREVAAHAQPESFENTTVVVRCDSTAWATQMRLMQHDLLKRFDASVGPGVVTVIKVIGPQGPSWKRGPRVAPGGRGPRDTYG